MRLVGKGSFFSFEFCSFEISKERHSKERSIYAYIRMNETFLSKQISKERQTNFERTLFDQTTYPGTERGSVGRISLDQNCLFSQDRNFHYQ